ALGRFSRCLRGILRRSPRSPCGVGTRVWSRMAGDKSESSSAQAHRWRPPARSRPGRSVGTWCWSLRRLERVCCEAPRARPADSWCSSSELEQDEGVAPRTLSRVLAGFGSAQRTHFARVRVEVSSVRHGLIPVGVYREDDLVAERFVFPRAVCDL